MEKQDGSNLMSSMEFLFIRFCLFITGPYYNNNGYKPVITCYHKITWQIPNGTYQFKFCSSALNLPLYLKLKLYLFSEKK